MKVRAREAGCARQVTVHRVYTTHKHYAVQSAQKRILSRTRKITPHVTNIPPSSHIPPPPIAHTVPHLSRRDPDFPWVEFLALSRTELEVGSLFRRFSHYLEVVSRWYCRFPFDGGAAGLAGARDPTTSPQKFPQEGVGRRAVNWLLAPPSDGSWASIMYPHRCFSFRSRLFTLLHTPIPNLDFSHPLVTSVFPAKVITVYVTLH